jgi:hypothetical protein
MSTNDDVITYARYKTPHHPHTNMAKAALNMLTRTSAEVQVTLLHPENYFILSFN